MGVSRRTVLIGSTALAAGVGFAMMRPKGYADMGRSALSQVYGDVGRGPVAEAFLADADAFLRVETKLARPLTLYFLDGNFGLDPGYSAQDWVAQFMVHRFAMSCNVIAAAETGEALEYAGFFDPLQGPCSNQLSAFNAP